MSPVRILILIGLFYLLFRFLINSGKRERPVEPERGADPGGPAQDVLMEDPVCHTLIPARQAITWQDNGKYLYFCSDNCRRQYLTSQGDQT